MGPFLTHSHRFSAAIKRHLLRVKRTRTQLRLSVAYEPGREGWAEFHQKGAALRWMMPAAPIVSNADLARFVTKPPDRYFPALWHRKN
jgi:hypothetical protein